MQRCRKCGAYSDHVNIHFDRMGICNYCGFYEKHRNVLEQKTALKNTFLLKMEIGKAKARASGSSYDCLAAFSGGKGSTYMIWQLKEVYHMRVLAFTFGTIGHKGILDRLDIDHITFSQKGPFSYPAYLHAIDRHSYLIAGQNKIPLILNGRSRAKILQYADTTTGTEPFETAHCLREYDKQIFQGAGLAYPAYLSDGTDLLDDIGAEAVSYFAYHDICEKDMIRSLEEKFGWIRPQRSHDPSGARSLSKKGELAFLVRKGELTPDQAEKML